MADAAGRELEEVHLLLAVLVEGQHGAVGVLLPAHGLHAKVGEPEAASQLARVARAAALLDLKVGRLALVTMAFTIGCETPALTLTDWMNWVRGTLMMNL